MAWLLAAAASAGELPGSKYRPSGEPLPIERLRGAIDLVLAEPVDAAKLAAALATKEIRRTEDSSPMRPNEQIYFAATEMFQVLRLSIERDKKWANATPHSLYLTPATLTNLTLSQMDQSFGPARPHPNLTPRGRSWVYAPQDKRFLAQIIGEFASEPTTTTRLTNLHVRIDRR